MTSTPQNSDSVPWRLMRLAALTLAMALLPTLFAALPAQGQTYAILHSFSGGEPDGGEPMAGLLLGPTGNLFGTASEGGGCATCDGTVFKLDTSGTLTVLHSFEDAEGVDPQAGVIRGPSGELYGTTYLTNGNSCQCGTVYKLYKGTLTVLHTFSGPDGSEPDAGLFRDAAGNLYGTTRIGGAFNHGTLFKLDTTGTLTVLHSFGANVKRDGRAPYAGLVLDGSGNAYGTTFYGGPSGEGTIYKLNLATGKYATLYSFPGPPGGASPAAGLIRDTAGNLYGTTYIGGNDNVGTIFKFDKRTSTVTVLYSFPWHGGGPEGAYPYGGLVRDSAGNLYGTTVMGGAYRDGTVFKLGTTNTLTVLHSFKLSTEGGGDGAFPFGSLVLDPAGNLFGTTQAGGAYGWGTIFKLTP
jgi:uncharacterized repeat protein (TIGR03803 family)